MQTLDFILKVFTFAGSVVAFILGFLQIRDRIGSASITIYTDIANISEELRLSPSQGDTMPAIFIRVVNRGRLPLYISSTYLIVDGYRRHKARPYPELLESESMRGLLEPDRARTAVVYRAQLMYGSGKYSMVEEPLPVQAVVACENGQKFESKVISVSPDFFKDEEEPGVLGWRWAQPHSPEDL